MTTEITGQLGRSYVAPSKASSNTVRFWGYTWKVPKTLYTLVAAKYPERVSAVSGEEGSGLRRAQSLTGALRKVVKADVSDSTPISTGSKTKDSSVTVPAAYETGGILESIKSGLKSYMPAILVIGSVILGIVIIKSAGSGGRK
jgi:hypothetical protein